MTSEYVPIIRSDRVWECSVLNEEESLKCLKFYDMETISIETSDFPSGVYIATATIAGRHAATEKISIR